MRHLVEKPILIFEFLCTLPFTMFFHPCYYWKTNWKSLLIKTQSGIFSVKCFCSGNSFVCFLVIITCSSINLCNSLQFNWNSHFGLRPWWEGSYKIRSIVLPSVLPSKFFLLLLVFPRFCHGPRNPYEVVLDCFSEFVLKSRLILFACCSWDTSQNILS